MPDLRFILLDTGECLESFLPEWTVFHAADPDATPFQHPAWLLPWWRQFGTDQLCAVAVYRGTSLRAFLPLYIYVEPASGERKLMLLGVGVSDYLDGVYAPDCTAEVVASALCWLAGRRVWDTLSLVQLRENSRLREAARQLFATPFAADPCSRLAACAICDLPVKIRRNAMYYANAARRRGTLVLSAADDSNCVERFEQLVQLHTARWQQQGESGVLADPRVLAWHREALPLLAHAGVLRLYTLSLAGETIAVMYALADPSEKESRAAYFYLPGFSLAHAELRPGTLLMAAAIEHAASEGILAIDLLRGNETYKQHWRAETVPVFGCTLPYAAMVNEPELHEAIA